MFARIADYGGDDDDDDGCRENRVDTDGKTNKKQQRVSERLTARNCWLSAVNIGRSPDNTPGRPTRRAPCVQNKLFIRPFAFRTPAETPMSEIKIGHRLVPSAAIMVSTHKPFAGCARANEPSSRHVPRSRQKPLN